MKRPAGRLQPPRIPLLALLLLCQLTSDPVSAETASGAPAATPLDAEAVALLINQAEAARQRAAELAAEWLETRKLIAEAREAVQRSDFPLAVQLATRARRQGELAVTQAEREATAWQRRVVR